MVESSRRLLLAVEFSTIRRIVFLFWLMLAKIAKYMQVGVLCGLTKTHFCATLPRSENNWRNECLGVFVARVEIVSSS